MILKNQEEIIRKLDKLFSVLGEIQRPLVACSGGLDSLLLSVVCHRLLPHQTLIAHAVSQAVPRAASVRMKRISRQEKWRVKYVRTGEMEDTAYLQNPHNRCYYCKRHLYGILTGMRYKRRLCTVLSGANTQDLSEYRPGLEAAREYGVRHPFIEAEISKEDIREICRILKLSFAEIPASPCLASRFYTGTEVKPNWLTLVDEIESRVQQVTGARIVRCRVKDACLMIEVGQGERQKLNEPFIAGLRRDVMERHPVIRDLSLDPSPYRPGRSFLVPA